MEREDIKETIPGFGIPKRELTKEEAEREITLERFRKFHYEAGEDFIDATGEGPELLFGGYLLCKYPEKSSQILAIVNEEGKFLEITSFCEVGGLGYDEKEDIDMVYQDFADFCNLTKHLKRRVNQVLIQVSEYYNQ